MQFLHEMGVDVWVSRDTQTQVPTDIATANEINNPTNCSHTSSNDWQSLRDAVSKCRACPLHQTRTNTVFGVGDQHADLMIVGEAPGANEDRQGEPFVGRAGQLLNQMLRAIGLERETVFIGNILKCRPPGNRDPQPEEVATCTPFLTTQIEYLQPKVIMAVGRIAAHFLLKTDQSLSRLRGTQHVYGERETPLIVTYHPAYLLRTPEMKAKAYQDLLLVKKLLA